MRANSAAAANKQVTIESLIAKAEAARAKAMSERGGAAAAVSALTAKAKLAGMWREKLDQHNAGSPVYERIERVIVERAPQSAPGNIPDESIQDEPSTEDASAFEGAYFAKALELARQEGRISHVAVDPILPVNAFFDIGGAGHSSDAMAIWIAQFVGREIRLLDYIEGVGQPLAYYAHELRRRGWKDVIVYLPHDGVARNNISGKRYIDHWIEAGFECGAPIKNTGAGAAMMRIEAARRVFPRCWFNESTEAGRDALGYYHERQDEKRSIGLGPEHDWSSHAADAFGVYGNRLRGTAG